MNPQGFLPVKPLPAFVVQCGQAVADLVYWTTGMRVPYQEGLMLIVSSIVMAVFIVLWVIIDLGNRADKRAHMAVLEARQPNARTTVHRRSVEADRAAERLQAAAGGSELVADGERPYWRDGAHSAAYGLRRRGP
ncbi:hypothetical protein HYH03_004035 [Edaphochlamys debaryana]|uniref:Uncharacterized protein n=1 Tax=Edaphochlamys debaryana TaxID=47281 RepID=A0A835Y7Z7_9CHLO|nr:hypothetical protein HYH03_004035 [Edaphochlamys debaryana]|eukprot:KAG2497763.1 hypothetical protein HYH03_004035 [Edaphochlamys debaryana]